jgi:hypothetical protein
MGFLRHGGKSRSILTGSASGPLHARAGVTETVPRRPGSAGRRPRTETPSRASATASATRGRGGAKRRVQAGGRRDGEKHRRGRPQWGPRCAAHDRVGRMRAAPDSRRGQKRRCPSSSPIAAVSTRGSGEPAVAASLEEELRAAEATGIAPVPTLPSRLPLCVGFDVPAGRARDGGRRAGHPVRPEEQVTASSDRATARGSADRYTSAPSQVHPSWGAR